MSNILERRPYMAHTVRSGTGHCLMAIVGTPEWRAFVAEPRGKAQLRDRLVEAMTEEDVAQLIHLCASGSKQEQEAAIRVLMAPAGSKDARMGSEARRRFADAVRSISRREYPNLPLGPLSLQALMDVEPKSAEAFLLNELTLDHLRPEQLKWVVINLQTLGTPPALARLQQLAATADETTAQAARRALEARGVVSPAALNDAVKQWRETRSSDALVRLYELHLRRLPEGTPMSEVEALLGPPSRRSGSASWYETDRGVLYVEQDTLGRLGGMKLK